MADPISVFQLIGAASGLALQCGKVINDLHTLSERYRYAELTISSMSSVLETVQWSWRRIDQILEQWTQVETAWEDDAIDVFQQLDRSLRGGTVVISALAGDLSSWTSNPVPIRFGLTRKAKVIWHESLLKDHQDRLRDQVNSMNLLMSVMQMPNAVVRRKALDIGQEVFQKSDQSAYSIIPSRYSRSLRDSILSSDSQTSLVYQELSIDSDLFTAGVYKRNYRNALFRRLLPKGKYSSNIPCSPTVLSALERQEALTDISQSRSLSITPAVYESEGPPLIPKRIHVTSSNPSFFITAYAEEHITTEERQMLRLPFMATEFISFRDLVAQRRQDDAELIECLAKTTSSDRTVFIRPKWAFTSHSIFGIRGPWLKPDLVRILVSESDDDCYIDLLQILDDYRLLSRVLSEGYDFSIYWLGYCLITACIKDKDWLARLILRRKFSLDPVRQEIQKHYRYSSPVLLALEHWNPYVLRVLIKDERLRIDCLHHSLKRRLLLTALIHEDGQMLADVAEVILEDMCRQVLGSKPVNLGIRNGVKRAFITAVTDAGVDMDLEKELEMVAHLIMRESIM